MLPSKADFNSMYKGLDACLGGQLTIWKKNIVNVYQGYLEEKLNRLLVELANNKVRNQDFLEFLESSSSSDKDFLYQVIRKSLDSKDEIKIFIMAKFLVKKIQNKELNYFEESLLANIENLVKEDFDTVFDMLGKYYLEQKPRFSYTCKEYQVLAINKFIAMALVYQPDTFVTNGSIRKSVDFKESEFTQQFSVVAKNKKRNNNLSGI